MKLQASCTPFETLPASVWQSVKRAILSAADNWGIPLTIEDDLTVREAEMRFEAWKRRPSEVD